MKKQLDLVQANPKSMDKKLLDFNPIVVFLFLTATMVMMVMMKTTQRVLIAVLMDIDYLLQVQVVLIL